MSNRQEQSSVAGASSRASASDAGTTRRRDANDPNVPAGTIPGPVFVRWFGTFFVLLSIGVLVGGFWVTSGVRRTAFETDNAMRTLGWEMLRWSAGHDGKFPTSETEFIDGLRFSADPPAPPPRARPSDADLWPADARTALQGRKPANIPDVLMQVKVQWSPDAMVAPEFSTESKPMLPGTADAVRGWLIAWVDHLQKP